jgi:hypothetical protein
MEKIGNVQKPSSRECSVLSLIAKRQENQQPRTFRTDTEVGQDEVEHGHELSFLSFNLLSAIRHVVPKVCFADPKKSATSSQRIRGYISVMATLEFDVLLKITAELL